MLYVHIVCMFVSIGFVSTCVYACMCLYLCVYTYIYMQHTYIHSVYGPTYPFPFLLRGGGGAAHGGLSIF